MKGLLTVRDHQEKMEGVEERKHSDLRTGTGKTLPVLSVAPVFSLEPSLTPPKTSTV